MQERDGLLGITHSIVKFGGILYGNERKLKIFNRTHPQKYHPFFSTFLALAISLECGSIDFVRGHIPVPAAHIWLSSATIFDTEVAISAGHLHESSSHMAGNLRDQEQEGSKEERTRKMNFNHLRSIVFHDTSIYPSSHVCPALIQRSYS